MIPAMQYLTERSFAKRVYNFIPIGKVVMVDDEIVTPFIIITVVVRRVIGDSKFFPAIRTKAIDRRIVQNFFALKF